MAASSSSSSRPSCVVNEADVPKKTLLDRFGEEDLKHGADGIAHVYNSTRQPLAKAAGAQKLGCSLMEVAPGGCTAFPYHAHAANEEAVYVLSGEGLMRMPAGDFSVTAGDYVSFLVGEAHAHQLWNFHTSLPLRYLCLSTEIDPDVCFYLDSGKVAAYTDNDTKASIHLRAQRVPYLRGEGHRYTPGSHQA